MKPVLIAAVIMLLAAGVYYGGCTKDVPQTSAEEVSVNQSKPQISPLSVKKDLSDWDSFLVESEAVIELNRQGIEALLIKIEEAGPKGSVIYGKKVTLLERKNRYLKKKLQRCRANGTVPEEESRVAFTQDLDRVGRSINILLEQKW